MVRIYCKNIIKVLRMQSIQNNRKAAGLSINVMIIAVIGLILLIVLVAMLTGRMGSFSGGLKSFGDAEKTCVFQGGTPEFECSPEETSILSSDASGQGKECCKPPE